MRSRRLTAPPASSCSWTSAARFSAPNWPAISSMPQRCVSGSTRDFFGGKTREVAPLYAVQSGLSYTFAPGGWVSLNAGYFKGGRTTVDEVESDLQLEGIRFGATLALPLNRYQSVKLYSISGYNTHREHDFQAFGIAWQYRWGGGY